MSTENPFEPGDRVLMKPIVEAAGRATAEQYAVTVLDVGVCDDSDEGCDCGKPRIYFADPESGDPDEAHAEDFLPC